MLNLIPFGERLYNDFHSDRLQLKTVSLFATISAKYKTVKPSAPQERSLKSKYLSKDVENNRATKYIQYAESRGKDIDYILQFPITTRPFYLMDKDGKVLDKATNRHELAKELFFWIKMI